jgi:pimeloyl-ACP methyl ester carboxylesterase
VRIVCGFPAKFNDSARVFYGTSTMAKTSTRADDIAIRRDFIVVSDIELHDRQCAIETQSMLVTLHRGAGASSLLVPPVRQRVRAHRVFAFDIPGCGDSTTIASTRSVVVVYDLVRLHGIGEMTSVGLIAFLVWPE